MVITSSSPQAVGDAGVKLMIVIGKIVAITLVLSNDSQLPLKAVT